MIIENKTPPNEPIPLDAPPSYDVVSRLSSQGQSSGSATRSTFAEEKDLFFHSGVEGPARTGQLSRPQAATPPSSSSWFNLGVFGSSAQCAPSPSAAQSPTPKSQADVRTTVQELVRDLVTSASTNGVTWAENATASFGVLDSCAAACARQHVSLSSILQERSIEGHTPLYWAIIKRPVRCASHRESILDEVSQELPEEDAVIWKLLSLSAPLTSYTLFEMRQACLATHSNGLLQQLRRSSLAFPLSGSEKMLLSGRNSGQHRSHVGFQDSVRVTEDAILTGNQESGNQRVDEDNGKNSSAEGGFRVRLEVEMFQRRMLVSGSVTVEFIARGRLWQLTFFVVPSLYPYLSTTPPSVSEEQRIPYAAISSLRALDHPPAPGMWACCLTTAPGSPQCWLDSRVVVKRPSASENTSAPLTLRLRTTSSPLQAHEPPPYTPLPLSLNASSLSSNSFPLFSSFSNPAEAYMSKEDKDALNAARKIGKHRTEMEKKIKQKWLSPDDRRNLKSEEGYVIVEVLEESGMGKLMYDNCPYITNDGYLRANFEAHLSPQRFQLDRTECVIC